MNTEILTSTRIFKVVKKSSNYNSMSLELKEERITGYCLWVPDRTGFIFLKKDQCIEINQEKIQGRA